MFKWLKRAIRKWLEEDDQPKAQKQETRATTIQAMENGQLKHLHIIGAAGPAILVLSGHGRRLIRCHECPDQRAFWKAWKDWSPENPNPVWDDGTPFLPKDQ